jgi:hypothetical protein
MIAKMTKSRPAMKSANELVHSFLLMGSHVLQINPVAIKTPPTARSQATRRVNVRSRRRI